MAVSCDAAGAVSQPAECGASAPETHTWSRVLCRTQVPTRPHLSSLRLLLSASLPPRGSPQHEQRPRLNCSKAAFPFAAPSAHPQGRPVTRRATVAAGGVVLVVMALAAGLAAKHEGAPREAFTRPPATRSGLPLPRRPIAANTVVNLSVFGPHSAVVLTAHRLLFTASGGHRWRNSPPPQQRLGGAAISFVTESRGRLAVASRGAASRTGAAPSAQSTSIQISLYSTTTAGHQWRRLASPPVVSLPPGQLTVTPLFTQCPIEHLAVTSAESQGNSAGVLLTSIDGGAHWQEPTPLPAGGAITFASANVGWMAEGDRIFVTRNGGSTWRQKFSLPLVTPALTAGELWGHPLLVSATTWVLPVQQAPAGSGLPRTRFVVTSDAGAHWKVITAPGGGVPAAVTGSDWLVLTGNGREVTYDEGRTWALRTVRWHANATFGGTRAGSTVIRVHAATLWWAVTQAEQCAASRPCQGVETVFLSTDRGRVWTQLYG